MELVKKNMVSIICGVVALLAVGAVFWPISGYYAELQEKVRERKTVHDSISTLIRKSRNLPVIDASNAGKEPEKLDRFPNSQIIKSYQAVTDQIKAESSDMFNAAVKMNTHELIEPGVLPGGQSTSPAFRFRDAYKKKMDLATEEGRKNSMPATILKPAFIPSEAAVAARKAEVEKEMREKVQIGPTGLPLDPGFNDALKTRLARVLDEVRLEAANKGLMYLDAPAVKARTVIMTNTSGAPDLRDIYIAHVGYWIQQDVFEALRAANKDAKAVMDAPVKHLFDFKFHTTALQPLEANAPPANSPPSAMEPGGTWPVDFRASPSGRVSNGVFDVYRFDLKIMADAEQVPMILQELSRGRFITVNRCDVASRDSADYLAKGYHYGRKPIVQLDMQCEALLFRQWTKPLMPPAIRAALGIPPDEPKPAS